MKTQNDKLREAFKRAYIGRQIAPVDNAIHLGQYNALPLAPDLPEPPQSFTGKLRAAIRRGLVRR